MWLFFAILSALMAAGMTIIGKLGLKNIEPTLATGVRSLVMFLFMLSVVGFTGKLKQIAFVDSKSLSIIVASAVLGALSWLCYFIALKYAPATKVAAIDRLSLILVIILSVLFLGEKGNAKLAVGSLLATAGIVLITLA